MKSAIPLIIRLATESDRCCDTDPRFVVWFKATSDRISLLTGHKVLPRGPLQQRHMGDMATQITDNSNIHFFNSLFNLATEKIAKLYITKLSVTALLYGEFSAHRRIPVTKGQKCKKGVSMPLPQHIIK